MMVAISSSCLESLENISKYLRSSEGTIDLGHVLSEIIRSAIEIPDNVEEGTEGFARKIEQLRTQASLSAKLEVLSPESEQYSLLALTALEQAQRFFTLAHYMEMQRR